MPDVISDTNGKLCVGSYHMWRLLSSPDNYSLVSVKLNSQLVQEKCQNPSLLHSRVPPVVTREASNLELFADVRSELIFWREMGYSGLVRSEVSKLSMRSPNCRRGYCGIVC